MSANAAVVAEAVDRSKRSGRAMPLQAASPIRTERLAVFDASSMLGAWMALPNAWLEAANQLGKLASPEATRRAVLSLADRQLQVWQTMLRMSPAPTLLKEQARMTEALLLAWQRQSGATRPRVAKPVKHAKAS
jgi:hypothetical protein